MATKPLDFARFCATSITFMNHIRRISVSIDQYPLFTISKTPGSTKPAAYSQKLNHQSPCMHMTMTSVSVRGEAILWKLYPFNPYVFEQTWTLKLLLRVGFMRTDPILRYRRGRKLRSQKNEVSLLGSSRFHRSLGPPSPPNKLIRSYQSRPSQMRRNCKRSIALCGFRYILATFQ